MGMAAPVYYSAEMVRALPDRSWIIAPPDWEPLLRSTQGERLTHYQRTVFRDAPSSRDRLAALMRSLPPGYRISRVSASEVERFAAFDRDLVKCFRDLDHFLAAGFGFAVEHDGEIVAGCSSFTQADGLVEIEIDTAREHRRRGLALAAGSALVLHCLESGLVPCWDAANEASARLASRIGFADPLTYRAWSTRTPGRFAAGRALALG